MGLKIELDIDTIELEGVDRKEATRFQEALVTEVTQRLQQAGPLTPPVKLRLNRVDLGHVSPGSPGVGVSMGRRLGRWIGARLLDSSHDEASEQSAQKAGGHEPSWG